MNRAACSTCRAPIFWAVFAGSGKRAPVNFEPAANGNLIITGRARSGEPLIDVIRRARASAGPTLFDPDPEVEPEPDPTVPRYLNHWATCENPPARKKAR